MELMTNQVFRLLQDTKQCLYPSGLFRVVFDNPPTKQTVCVCIHPKEVDKSSRGGRPPQNKTKCQRKKAPTPLVGDLIWMDRDHLERLEHEKILTVVEIERDPVYFETLLSPRKQANFERRCKAMKGFLDIENMKERILIHGGLGGLVRDAMAIADVCRSFVYKQWSTLCREGFSEISLLPRTDKCGAPTVARPCDPGGRKKSGRKTRTQRVAKKASGVELPPKQPGMSTEWRAAILAADSQIKTAVKPAMPKRCALILDSNFVKKYRTENSVLVPIEPKLGEYPNNQQIRRVLEVEIPRLLRLQQSTSQGHFSRSMRGLTARNWKGVAGPGHTWTIDSTIADIYLRSSLNRAWIVGRPVVYIVVDVWSTAIVGFYVCLTGPSWNTAKVSLFNSAADPDLLGQIWGYEPILSLYPNPTMCYQLLCDRGEYLSKAASLTSAELISDMAYTPPYRPDLKGLVEVIYRIAKDAQFLFEPGAMDARRAEFDLRKSHPDESAMTVREYVQYLHIIFAEYNLRADRSHRVDAHMAAAGVFPSPAGLWRWGHETGIGLRRFIPQADLVTTLLTRDTGRVGRSSVVFAGNDYISDVVSAEQWTTLARNFTGWTVPIHHYPGPVGRIWTPHLNGNGLVDLIISDQAQTSAEVTFDELRDVVAHKQMQRAEVAHQRTLLALQALRNVQTLRRNAVMLTRDAMDRAQGIAPTITEARLLEVACASSPCGSESQTAEKLRDEAMEAHEEMMRAMLHVSDDEESDNV